MADWLEDSCGHPAFIKHTNCTGVLYIILVGEPTTKDVVNIVLAVAERLVSGSKIIEQKIEVLRRPICTISLFALVFQFASKLCVTKQPERG